MEEEVGDRDPTYLRTRMVFSYDRKWLRGPASINRLRLKLLYAFGPKQRYAVSVLQPAIQTRTPLGAAQGSGDVEVQVTTNVYYANRFRTGGALQGTFQTSSDSLLGGATTIVKPSWDVAAVLSSRVELTGAFFYKRSIRGIPFKQGESDVTLNARVLNMTWFAEWDSYYDFIPERLAQTMKAGFSRGVGTERRWVVSAYYGTAINDYGRLSQFRHNAGIDATWYPRKYR